jgi:hypothetical protein
MIQQTALGRAAKQSFAIWASGRLLAQADHVSSLVATALTTMV